MPSLFRSEPTSFYQLLVQPETAYFCVAELGEIGIAHFLDLNPGLNSYQRKYVNEVKRCNDMERQLRFIGSEIDKQEIKLEDCTDNPLAPLPREMIDIEATLERIEIELTEVNKNTDALQRNFIELTELKHVLLKTEIYFSEREQTAIEDSTTAIAPQDASQLGTIKFSFIAGVINQERVPAFERMIWRVCHGKAFVRLVPIDEVFKDSISRREIRKSVFIIFFQGDLLKIKVKKICDGFRASVYHLPDTPYERKELVAGVMTRLADLNTVLSRSQDHRFRLLSECARSHPARVIRVRKMKAIFHTLNYFSFDVTQNCLIGECWVPDFADWRLEEALKKAHEASDGLVPPLTTRLETPIPPPTCFRTNKFTQGFQNIVEAYGVANYRELNPATYTVITFPFLFGVMFGDAGHGFIMTLFGAYLCIWEKSIIAKKIKDEMFNILFAGRYIILLMGLFSTYTGLVYNDVFSKSVNIFGSQWGSNFTDAQLEDPSGQLYLDANTSKNYYGQPYYYGVDPVWELAINNLNYMDSYKMKMSVIVGVIQMLFGLFVGLTNHIHFNKWSSIIFGFIPEFIFLMVIFGYLDVLIFWKWFKYDYSTASVAPNLIVTLINMFLRQGYDLQMYSCQTTVETAFVLAALLCIPLMLLFKPFFVRRHFNHAVRIGTAKIEFEELMDPEGNFMMGEAFVHSAIHTIEYCLGCISYTASYLRLWALSLAHNQLSDVLWTLVMRAAFYPQNPYYGAVILWGIFAFWACLTISILLCMEGLSAFLHALRLHWVEFQSKFYSAKGYAFQPLSFSRILEEDDQLTTT